MCVSASLFCRYKEETSAVPAQSCTCRYGSLTRTFLHTVSLPSLSLSLPTRPFSSSASLCPHTRLHKKIRQRFSAAHGQHARFRHSHNTLCLGWESPVVKATQPKLTLTMKKAPNCCMRTHRCDHLSVSTGNWDFSLSHSDCNS